jgi:REP element-mobilizing transposase RayT
MAIARAHLVNPALDRWYTCVTRCVGRAFLLGEGQDNRKAWIEQRLQELAQIFAVAVGGFSVVDNHLHVLLRIDPEAQFGVRSRRAGVADKSAVIRVGLQFTGTRCVSARGGPR